MKSRIRLMTNKTKVFTRHLIRLLIAMAISSTLLAVPSAANASANSIIDNPSRPTLIFVFQPFCQYCKRAAPFVAQLHAQLGADMDFVWSPTTRITRRIAIVFAVNLVLRCHLSRTGALILRNTRSTAIQIFSGLCQVRG